MKPDQTETKGKGSVTYSALLGHCVATGDDDSGQPRVLIHTTQDVIMHQARNMLFEDVAVIRIDELDTAEVVAFDGQARTITLHFDLMPHATIGERWLVRPNTVAVKPTE